MLSTALTTVILALAGSLVLFFVVLRYLPEARFGRGLMLDAQITASVGRAGSGERWVGGGAGEAPRAPSALDPRAHLVGRRGMAQTDLRPAGKALVEGALLDVVGQMAWIDRGTHVRVVEVEGVRVVVAPIVGEPRAEAAGLGEESGAESGAESGDETRAATAAGEA